MKRSLYLNICLGLFFASMATVSCSADDASMIDSETTYDITSSSVSSPKEIQAALKNFNKKYAFHVGQVVTWKPGQQNRSTDGPFVVVSLLNDPVVDGEKDSGSTYFNEPLDIVLGTLKDDGIFVIYHFDSRRFQPLVAE